MTCLMKQLGRSNQAQTTIRAMNSILWNPKVCPKLMGAPLPPQYHNGGDKNTTANLVWACPADIGRMSAKTNFVAEFSRKTETRKAKEELDRGHKRIWQEQGLEQDQWLDWDVWKLYIRRETDGNRRSDLQFLRCCSFSLTFNFVC